jgi:hypothetical protein
MTPYDIDAEIARYISLGTYDPECPYCAPYIEEHRETGSAPMMPSHTARERCESGKREHCSCGVCF